MDERVREPGEPRDRGHGQDHERGDVPHRDRRRDELFQPVAPLPSGERDGVDRLSVARSVLLAADMNVKQARRALEMTEANYRLGAAIDRQIEEMDAVCRWVQGKRRSKKR